MKRTKPDEPDETAKRFQFHPLRSFADHDQPPIRVAGTEERESLDQIGDSLAFDQRAGKQHDRFAWISIRRKQRGIHAVGDHGYLPRIDALRGGLIGERPAQRDHPARAAQRAAPECAEERHPHRLVHVAALHGADHRLAVERRGEGGRERGKGPVGVDQVAAAREPRDRERMRNKKREHGQAAELAFLPQHRQSAGRFQKKFPSLRQKIARPENFDRPPASRAFSRPRLCGATTRTFAPSAANARQPSYMKVPR